MWVELGGPAPAVVRESPEPDRLTVHDFDGFAGGAPVLVHNADYPVPISQGRWDHIWDRHVKRNDPEWSHKSKFDTTSKAKIQKMINRALGGETDDGVHVYRFPQAIGKTAKGEGRFGISLVIRDHKLITAYPPGK